MKEAIKFKAPNINTLLQSRINACNNGDRALWNNRFV